MLSKFNSKTLSVDPNLSITKRLRPSIVDQRFLMKCLDVALRSILGPLIPRFLRFVPSALSASPYISRCFHALL